MTIFATDVIGFKGRTPPYCYDCKTAFYCVAYVDTVVGHKDGGSTQLLQPSNLHDASLFRRLCGS